MEYIQIEPRNAEKAKRLLMRLKLFDSSRAAIHSRSYVFFPTLNIMHAKTIKLFNGMGGSIVTKKEQEIQKKNGFEDKIGRIVGKKELAKLSKGYDQIGDIAIIEFSGTKKSEKKIANTLIQSNKSIKTVLAKDGAVSGKYRIRKLRYIAGRKNYIANYKENGCTFRFDLRKVYFSNRLSFERSRILKLVKPKENVMVMFAGFGPFAIEIAKTVSKTKVVGIEINKSGYKYMLDNIKLNKLNNVKAVLGDVKKKAGIYRNFADRIIMPLPKSSLDFLDESYKIAKKRAVVHLYSFAKGSDPFQEVYKKVMEHSRKNNYGVRIIGKRIVRPYSSNESEIVLDYALTK